MMMTCRRVLVTRTAVVAVLLAAGVVVMLVLLLTVVESDEGARVEGVDSVLMMLVGSVVLDGCGTVFESTTFTLTSG